MKTTKKPCSHLHTRMRSRIGKRVLALCCGCATLVWLPAGKAAK